MSFTAWKPLLLPAFPGLDGSPGRPEMMLGREIQWFTSSHQTVPAPVQASAKASRPGAQPESLPSSGGRARLPGGSVLGGALGLPKVEGRKLYACFLAIAGHLCTFPLVPRGPHTFPRTSCGSRWEGGQGDSTPPGRPSPLRWGLCTLQAASTLSLLHTGPSSGSLASPWLCERAASLSLAL